WFDSLDSTNRYLLDEARRGAPEGLVAVADVQTAGRGRRGRGWIAPPGASLLVSVLLRPALAPEQTPLVAMACGVAVVDAVARFADLDAVVVEYRARLATLGRRVRVERPDGELVGRAVGLGAVGQLRVEVDGGDVLEVHVGDVVHLRDA